jgi:predicted peptidase
MMRDRAMRCVLLAVLAAMAMPLVGFCYSASDMVYRSHPTTALALPYRLFIPRNYSGARRYPIILTFHGVGECGTDNSAQLNNGIVTPWLQDSVQQREPCFVVSPQCPSGAKWANFSWSNDTYRIDFIPLSTAMSAVVSMLDSLKREFSLDTTRFYVTGLSMGGCGTWDIIGRFPAMFAAAIPLCGVGDSSRAPNFASMAVWAFHGATDGVVPVGGSRNPVAAMERRGVSVVRYTSTLSGASPNMPWQSLHDSVYGGSMHLYTEYSDGTHLIWDATYANPLLPAWLLSKRRSLPVRASASGDERGPFPGLSTRAMAGVSGADRMRTYSLDGRCFDARTSCVNAPWAALRVDRDGVAMYVLDGQRGMRAAGIR